MKHSQEAEALGSFVKQRLFHGQHKKYQNLDQTRTDCWITENSDTGNPKLKGQNIGNDFHCIISPFSPSRGVAVIFWTESKYQGRAKHGHQAARIPLADGAEDSFDMDHFRYI